MFRDSPASCFDYYSLYMLMSLQYSLPPSPTYYELSTKSEDKLNIHFQ
jgi:hypothetical protein